MGRIEKRLPKKVMDVLENCGWRLNIIEKQDGEYRAEIENWSPAGEDLIETVCFDGTSAGFCKSFRQNANSFDVDDHVEMWIDSRGENGVPETARELVEDAEAIREMLNTLADELGELY